MSRGRYTALAAIAVLVPGAILAWQNFPDDETKRATVNEALERFRERAAASGEGPGGAAPGVYRYRTRGSEHTDTGLLSATHDYDGISTVTVARGPCGVVERWQVLAGRWTEAEFCVPPRGSGLRAITEFHEFFGRERNDTYRCRGRAPSRRLLRRVGTRFSSVCRSGPSSARSTSRVVGVEQFDLRSGTVPAIHTISRVVLGGNVSGGTTREDWRRRSDGLLLRRKVDTDAKMSGTIDADYTERYTIDLLSLRPRR